jgi:6-phosphofructokinase
MLNEIAWTLLTDEKIKNRNLKLATRLALAAVDASEGKDASVLDTYARALFDTGKIEEAVTQQKKAVALADDADKKRELEATLKEYQKKAAK